MAGDDNGDDIRTERWCAGLRFETARPMTPHERATLTARTDRVLKLRYQAVGLAVLLMFWPLALGAVRPGDLPAVWMETALIAVIVAGWVIGLPALIVFAVDLSRTRARHLRDLARGELLVFSGEISQAEPVDDEQRQLFAAGLLRLEPGATQQLAVFPESRTVGWIDGEGRESFRTLRINETAIGPNYAMRVPLSHEVAWSPSHPDVRVLKRSLNGSEREEIRRHIRRLERPGPVTMLMAGMLAVCIGVVTAFVPSGIDKVFRGAPAILLQIPLSILALAGYVRDVRLAYKLRLDAHTGWALTMERESERECVADGTSGEAFEVETEPVREFLPHSLTVWSEAGKPARWRDLRRAA